MVDSLSEPLAVVPTKKGIQGVIHCHLCPKTFDTRGMLNRHFKQHSKPYGCTYCPKGFALRADLYRHLGHHEITTRKFLCHVSTCKFKGATRKDNLRRHLQICHPQEMEVEKLCKQAQSDQKLLTDSSSLLRVAEAGNEVILKWLLSHHASTSTTTDEGKTALHVAARNGHMACVKLLLNAGASLHALDVMGNSVLHDAVRSTRCDIVQTLLDRDIPLSLSNDQGNTALHESILSGNSAIVQVLLQRQDIDVNVANSRNKTPLHIAVKKEQIELVKLLLQKGAKPDPSDIYSPLDVACRIGNQHLIRILVQQILLHGRNKTTQNLIRAAGIGDETTLEMLLENGIDVNMSSNYVGSILYQAVIHNNATVIQRLLMHGAKIRRFSCDPLKAAISKGLEDVVRMFLESGMRAKDLSDSLRIVAKAKNKCLKIVQLLVKHGANVHSKEAEEVLWVAALEPCEEIVDFLLAKRLSIDPHDVERCYDQSVRKRREDLVLTLTRHGLRATSHHAGEAFVQAAKEGHEELVHCLLRSGLDPDDYRENGWRDGSPALQTAAEAGHDGIGRLLLRYGASVDKSDYWTRAAIWHAVKSGHETFVKLLIEHGASVNFRSDETNYNIVRSAVQSRNESMLRTLLEHGAKVLNRTTTCAEWVETALEIAVQQGKLSTVHLLIAHGADITTEREATQVAARSLLESH